MFDFLKRSKPPAFEELRELLFGDAPLATWAPSAPDFAAATLAGSEGDAAGVESVLHRIVQTPALESRHKLQAYRALRELGVLPNPLEAKRVLGVVLEIQLDGGLDTLAAYADHSARYINHGGKIIIWDTPEPPINACIDELLSAGQRVADAIGPWEGPRQAPPPKSYARVNMLTPSGLHFGEAPFATLAADPVSAPIINAGTKLMQALIERTQ